MPKILWDDWDRPARPATRVLLQFGEGKRRKALRNISAGARLDDTLFLAADEYCTVARTTGLSGPCAIYRWRGWASDPAHDPSKVHLHRPERVLELPFGRDHPEGLVLWTDGKDGRMRILVINDSPADERIDLEARALLADVFALPD